MTTPRRSYRPEYPLLRLHQTKAKAYRKYTVKEQGQFDDLVLSTPTQRVWVSRVELDARGNALVTVENWNAAHLRWEITAVS